MQDALAPSAMQSGCVYVCVYGGPARASGGGDRGVQARAQRSSIDAE